MRKLSYDNKPQQSLLDQSSSECSRDKQEANISTWTVYLLECHDGSLYCGATNNITKRMQVHNRGKGAKYTRSRLPVRLLVTSDSLSKSDALKLEYSVKKQKANEKVDYLKLFV